MLAYTGGASFGHCLGRAPDWLPFLSLPGHVQGTEMT